MNYLYFSPFATDCINASVLLEDAFRTVNNEPEANIYFVYLDYPGVIINDFNSERSIFRNREIAFDNKLLLSKYRHERIHPIGFSKIKNNDIIKSYDFTSLEDVKYITYNNMNIGYGVVSNYVSFTRNINPVLSDPVRKYITDFLNADATIMDALVHFIKDSKIDFIKSYNGRYATLRVPIDIAEGLHIPYSTLEMLVWEDPKNLKYFEYYNQKPHSITLRTKIFHDIWTDEDEKEPEKYASFYERRASGKKAGDKVYVSLQEKKLLPEKWNEVRKNYVFFTSSEDEFFSIGDEWDELRIFPNQIEAAKTLANLCAMNDNIHLYIRIHPNLIGIPYSYAKFDELDMYKNVTVIPAASPVSTYQLLYSCDRAFTMGSTMGIEATYWNKPSILLNASMYFYMNVAYTPRNIDELKKMVLAEKLDPKPKKGCFLYAKYIMEDKFGRSAKYVNFSTSPLCFNGKILNISKAMTIFGSRTLYKLSVAVFRILYLMSKRKYLKEVFPYMLIERE